MRTSDSDFCVQGHSFQSELSRPQLISVVCSDADTPLKQLKQCSSRISADSRKSAKDDYHERNVQRADATSFTSEMLRREISLGEKQMQVELMNGLHQGTKKSQFKFHVKLHQKAGVRNIPTKETMKLESQLSNRRSEMPSHRDLPVVLSTGLSNRQKQES